MTLRPWDDRPLRPIQKAAYGAAALAILMMVLVTVNSRFGWYPQLTWPAIYQNTGLGVYPFSDMPCQVRVLDVGAGDCILIRAGESHILVDTGTKVHQKETAAELSRLGVSELDCLVLTHYHDDHTGGTEEILSCFSPKQILLGWRDKPSENEEYRRIMDLCSRANCEVIIAQSGMAMQFGEIALHVLHDGNGFTSENNRSLVLKMVYKNNRMLLMGDAEQELEDALLASGEDLSADWIKIGHHGSSTSTGDLFLAAVGPKFASISCGFREQPDQEVLEKLRKIGVVYSRTDLNGAVLFSSNGQQCELQVEKGKKIS